MSDTHETPEAAPPKKKKGLMAIVKAVAVVTVIVLAELAGASMLIPTAEETKAVAEKFHGEHGADKKHDGEEGEHAGQEKHDDAHGEEGEHGKEGEHGSHEVSLGEFHVLRFDPKSGDSFKIDFDLHGVVLASEEEEFYHLYESNQNRIDEQITIAMRGMEIADLSDPGLGLIKRTILEKVNRTLGKPLVREAIISSFVFYER